MMQASLMRRQIAKRLAAAALAVGMLLLAGCTMLSEEQVKLQDLGFTVVSEEKLPEELKTVIDEKKQEAFQLTYSDAEFLYIVIGYGKQPQGGYSIAVNELYLTEDAIFVNTTLLGPEDIEGVEKVPSYPYIVLKMDYLDKPVVFQ